MVTAGAWADPVLMCSNEPSANGGLAALADLEQSRVMGPTREARAVGVDRHLLSVRHWAHREGRDTQPGVHEAGSSVVRGAGWKDHRATTARSPGG